MVLLTSPLLLSGVPAIALSAWVAASLPPRPPRADERA
jgi:hypothetical protein